jgi:hypothetical protein
MMALSERMLDAHVRATASYGLSKSPPATMLFAQRSLYHALLEICYPDVIPSRF